MEAPRLESAVPDLRLVPGLPRNPTSWSACAGLAGFGGVALAALGLSTPVLATAGQRAAAASAGSWLFFAGLLIACSALAMSRGSRVALWGLRTVALAVAWVLPHLVNSAEAGAALWGALAAWGVASALAEWSWVRTRDAVPAG